MEPKAVVWFLLSVQTVTRAVPVVFPPHNPKVSTAYTLSAGLQAVQSVSMGQIARLLDIPSDLLKIPENSLGADTPLRQALDVACRVRSRVELLAGVEKEMPGDLEVTVVLEVMRQVQRDTYRWLSTLIEKDISGLTENTLDNMCLQWEALVTAEEAEQSLQEFLTESGLTAQDQQQKQITSVTTSEIIMSYFSP